MAFSQSALDLFPLPAEWLPDETLFSLCSRIHYLSGRLSAKATCQILFAHPQRGSQHDLPSEIDHFVSVTGGRLGWAEDIINAHTLLPFYLPFHDSTMAENAMAAMRKGGIGALKFQLGLLTSRFRGNHPLKACACCLNEDSRNFNTNYWHLHHQLPGVWICPIHHEPLLVSQQKHTGVGRFFWFLPTETTLMSVIDPQHLALAKAYLIKIADFASRLPHLGPAYFDQNRLTETFRRQMRTIGFRSGSRIQLEEAATAFSTFCAPLRAIEELQGLPSSPEEAKSQLSRLLQPSRSHTHPIRTIVLGVFLFESWNDFVYSYQHIELDRPCLSNDGNLSHSTNPVIAKAIRLLTHDGMSCRAAAAELGVDTYTIMTWATDAGIVVKRRPKLLKEEIRAAVITDLKCGHDKSIVAIRHGISIESVTRLLSTEIGLRAAWNRARFLIAQTKARESWLQITQNNPMLGPKAVRILEPAAYMWLYRNDRAWLANQLCALPITTRANNSRVNWDRRDTELASLVDKAVLSIVQEMPGCRITLQMIYQRTPSLKPKLSRLDRLPLTKRAIDSAVKAPLLPPGPLTLD